MEEERKKYCGNCGNELIESIEDDGIKLIECYYFMWEIRTTCKIYSFKIIGV